MYCVCALGYTSLGANDFEKFYMESDSLDDAYRKFSEVVDLFSYNPNAFEFEHPLGVSIRIEEIQEVAPDCYDFDDYDCAYLVTEKSVTYMESLLGLRRYAQRNNYERN